MLALIISEAIQQALVDRDGSLTGAFLVVVTLVGADVLFSYVRPYRTDLPATAACYFCYLLSGEMSGLNHCVYLLVLGCC